MNSGAPASTAPPDFSSLGMMASHRNSSVAYCGAEKYFGVYAPAGAAAFSLWTIWWTYSAASAGITWSTEPAAVTARVRRMSRREMESLGMVGLTKERKKDLTPRPGWGRRRAQRTQRAQRRRETESDGRGKPRPCDETCCRGRAQRAAPLQGMAA